MITDALKFLKKAVPEYSTAPLADHTPLVTFAIAPDGSDAPPGGTASQGATTLKLAQVANGKLTASIAVLTASNAKLTDLTVEQFSQLNSARAKIEELQATRFSDSAGSAVPPKSTAFKPSYSFVVSSTTDPKLKTGAAMRTALQKSDFGRTALAAEKAETLSNGKVRLTYATALEREKAMKAVAEKTPFIAEEAKTYRPAITLKGISAEAVEQSEVLQKLFDQNEAVRTACKDEEIKEHMKIIGYQDNRMNNKLYNAFIELSPPVFRAVFTAFPDHRIACGMQKVHFEEKSPLRQCFKCLWFGHTTKKCPEEKNTAFVDRCSHCGGDHKYRLCKHRQDNTKLCCFNCHKGGSHVGKEAKHGATSTRCPIVTSYLEKQKGRVDYG